MIYDCFLFFNELDLLEIRLNELNPVVDKFVLVEATRTFQKEPKPLYYSENKERFKKFSDKIIHIVVDKYPGFFHKFRIPTAWDYDVYQKNQIESGLTVCRPEDVVIISDLDEIPMAGKVLEYKDRPGIKVFQQRLSYYFVNCIAVDAPPAPHLVKQNGFINWRGSVMIDYKDFKSAKDTRILRDMQGPGIIQIENGGWHFSFLGGWEKVRYKLKSWAHAKEKKYAPDYIKDEKKLEELICDGKDIFDLGFIFSFCELDSSFPQFILNHKEKYSHLIKEIKVRGSSIE